MKKRPRAIAAGTIFGGRVDCYVLDDGRRVISQRGAVRALIGGSGHGAIDRYVGRLPLKYRGLEADPTIEFDSAGGPALGREGTWLMAVCDAYVDAQMAGDLLPSQHRLALSARALLKAVQAVGITALIDEATNYQAVRASGDLASLLDRVLRHEASKWEKRFPASLVRALAPLYDIPWTGGRYPSALRKPFGMIYEHIMGPAVMGEVRERNPDPRMGSNHHQHFKEDVQGLLVTELRLVEYIASQSRSPTDFWRRMRAHFKKEALQLDLGGAA